MASSIIFCDWHIATKENPAGTDCAAHLDSARCFECPYTIEKIRYDKKGFYISQTGKRIIGECQDFKLLPKLEKKLEVVPPDKKLNTLKNLLYSEIKE